jgi:diacylglycerol O-acyltransferase / wax synthase
MKTLALKPVDAAWLMLDSSDTPMHVGVLAIFQKPRNAAPDYLGQLATRMRAHTKACAPWNYRLSGDGVVGVLSRLVEVRDFDLNYHFQHSALPEPGGERELGVVVSRLHSPALDRNRPLWEFHLIEGLERDRFAFYLKIHHALVSDVNAIPLMFSMLDDSARSRNMAPLWTRPIAAAVDEEDLEDRASTAVESLRSLGKAGMGVLRTAISPGNNAARSLLRSAPRSTLNRHINQQRRFATQQFPQQRIEQLAAATSSTVNEILTYICGTSLRRFFKEYNALPDESLVGTIPVSLHERDTRIPGNAIAGIRVELGTHIGDPLARLAAVKESIKAVRKDRQSLPEEAVTPYVLLRAAPLFASQLPGVGRFVPPVYNLNVSNTIGVDTPMYFDGARLDAIYPLSQLMQFTALSIDCVNYAGTLNIGFTGARDTLPHLQRMAVYVGQAVTDLEDMVRNAEDAA